LSRVAEPGVGLATSHRRSRTTASPPSYVPLPRCSAASTPRSPSVRDLAGEARTS